MQTRGEGSSNALAPNARQARPARSWLAIIIAFLLLGGLCGWPVQYWFRWSVMSKWNWSHAEIAASKQSAELIIAELQRIHGATGKYPANIDAIVAALPAEHQRPAAGERRWRYEVFDDGNRCLMRFKVRGENYVNWYVRSEEDFRWQLDS